MRTPCVHGVEPTCIAPNFHIHLLSGTFKQLLFIESRAQIVSTVSWATATEWSEPMTTFGSVLSIAQLNLLEVLPINCIGTVTFYSQLFAATLVPTGLAAACAAFAMVGLVTRQLAIYLTLALAFVVLPSTSLVLFRFFDCLEFEDGSSWLVPDLSESCDSDTYLAIKGYVLANLFIFPLGIPLAFFASRQMRMSAILRQTRTTPDPNTCR